MADLSFRALTGYCPVELSKRVSLETIRHYHVSGEPLILPSLSRRGGFPLFRKVTGPTLYVQLIVTSEVLYLTVGTPYSSYKLLVGATDKLFCEKVSQNISEGYGVCGPLRAFVENEEFKLAQLVIKPLPCSNR